MLYFPYKKFYKYLEDGSFNAIIDEPLKKQYDKYVKQELCLNEKVSLLKSDPLFKTCIYLPRKDFMEGNDLPYEDIVRYEGIRFTQYNLFALECYCYRMISAEKMERKLFRMEDDLIDKIFDFMPKEFGSNLLDSYNPVRDKLRGYLTVFETLYPVFGKHGPNHEKTPYSKPFHICPQDLDKFIKWFAKQVQEHPEPDNPDADKELEELKDL